MFNSFGINLESIRKRYIAYFFMVFIALQPILDLSTAFTKIVLGLEITPGIIIRFIIMLLGMIYILTKSINSKNKSMLYYLVLLVILFLINLTVSYFNKPVFNLFTELKSIAKLAYLYEMFVVFYIAFRDINDNEVIQKFYPKNFFYSQVIIGIVMLISYLTNTGIQSYDGVLKSGHSGWFYAANELGTLLGLVFPIVLWYFLVQSNMKNTIISWLVSLTAIYSMIAVGTKVGFLALMIALVVALSVLILYILLNKKSMIFKRVKLLLLIVTLIGVIVSIPYLPVTQNTNSHVRYINETEQIVKENNLDETEEDNLDLNKDDNLNENDVVFTQVIYSGRDDFERRFEEFYDEANIYQKLFGMGYAGNYEDVQIIIERDFHDVFYQFGWIGSLVLLSPTIYFVYFLFKVSISDIKKLLNVKYILSLTSILIGLGVGFIAGHTLMAPAVSTYLAIIAAYLYYDLKKNETVKE